MDINCTHACMHQQDGKCHLTDITAARHTTPGECADCPYFSRGDSRIAHLM